MIIELMGIGIHTDWLSCTDNISLCPREDCRFGLGFPAFLVAYDTVHVWNGRFFRLDLHLDRFFGRLNAFRAEGRLRR